MGTVFVAVFMALCRLLALFGLLAAPAYASGIGLGIGCANPCGQEVVAPGGTADCIVFVQNVSSMPDLIVVEAITIAVDGIPEAILAAPATIDPGHDVSFPFTVSSDVTDPVGTRIFVHSDVQGEVLFGGTSSSGPVDFGGFGTAVTVVADPMCDVTTTTATTATTTSQPPVTTTTLPPPGPKVPNGHAWGWHRKFGN